MCEWGTQRNENNVEQFFNVTLYFRCIQQKSRVTQLQAKPSNPSANADKFVILKNNRKPSQNAIIHA